MVNLIEGLKLHAEDYRHVEDGVRRMVNLIEGLKREYGINGQRQVCVRRMVNLIEGLKQERRQRDHGCDEHQSEGWST